MKMQSPKNPNTNSQSKNEKRQDQIVWDPNKPQPQYFRIKVIPKSNKNEWVETLADGTLKIRIAAPPEKGKANAELIKFLSKEWNIRSTSIQIISGKTDPIKLIKIQNETS